MNEYVLTINDVENAIKEHLLALDVLWPDHDQFGPRKVHVVEIIEGIKLKLHQLAQENNVRSENSFMRAARKITNSPKELPRVKEPEPVPEQKSEMQLKFEKAREDRRNRMKT
jgi:hypothetical protein